MKYKKINQIRFQWIYGAFNRPGFQEFSSAKDSAKYLFHRLRKFLRAFY